jgi:hypothetical protein
MCWEIAADMYNADAASAPQDGQPRTVPQLARCAWLREMPVEEMNVDQVRARIYGKHGNLLNAFRHFDLSGDSRISYDEFMRALPKALGETISLAKVNEIWKAMDTDGTGEIDIQEFASDQFVSSTNFGAKLMKGLTVDVSQGERPSHHKYTENGGASSSPERRRNSGEVHQSQLEPAMQVHQPNMEMDQDKVGKPMLDRPESASTMASMRERPLQRPQSAKSVTSVADSKTSFDEYSDSGFEASSTAF